jgi:hypothetical protein
LDVVDGYWVKPFGGLTCDFWAKNAKNNFMTAAKAIKSVVSTFMATLAWMVEGEEAGNVRHRCGCEVDADAGRPRRSAALCGVVAFVA